MKKGTVRTAIVIFVFVIITYTFTNYVYKTNQPYSSPEPSAIVIPKEASKDQEKQYQSIFRPKIQKIDTRADEEFMSFFPHGDFATQHEAVRNAFRIALETKRTLILPHIRLGKREIPWAPFPILQKYYESQDKDVLKLACAKKHTNWYTQYQPCRDLNQWIELPWSSLFDLKAVTDQFDIRIIERSWDHGWGVHEAKLSHIGLTQDDVIVVDANSFPSNGSDWELKQQISVDNLVEEAEQSMTLKAPLKNLVTSDQLLKLKQKYVQFGSLVFGLRYQTTLTKQQVALQKALRSTVFTSPNQYNIINNVAHQITQALGGTGKFNVVHMNLETILKVELQNRASMSRENAEIEGKSFTDKTAYFDSDGVPLKGSELLKQLNYQDQSELMSAVVRELQGDMPINQAISAALPLQPSLLKDFLSVSSVKEQRRDLLSACIDYHTTVDQRYPICFLTNDVYSDVFAHPELFGPFTKAFPCTFTKQDVYEWGAVDPKWASQINLLQDVDYEDILSPIIEILVAKEGKN
ncbi:hypothetical protein BD560DRAFT_402870 [Blakeslea trispora]|nr:hypothetical protein BD560DRAFT_402870 [Blakeslea trispora]